MTIALENPQGGTPVDRDRLRERLCEIVGERHVLTGGDIEDFGTGWSRLGKPLALVRPADTDQVSACVSACAHWGVPVVPWGGRTGLVSGTCADEAIAISLDRMNRIVAVNPTDCTMLVEAGCVVEAAMEAARREGLFFALDLGSRGTATVGGVIATNAGGNRVLRFGMMREIVLGLETVLADGTVLSSLQPLIKNNTGYDLKQLFIGSEGTLGIVTRAVLRLRPEFPSRNAALVAAEDFSSIARLLRHLESRLGGQLSAFEAMWPEFYDLVTTPPARGRPILPHGHAFYVLVEAMGGSQDGDKDQFELALETALAEGLVTDAVIAQSEAEIAAMWALRDDGEQVGRIGPFVALDISLPVSRIATFASELREELDQKWPGTACVLFGHVGDGNIHIVLGAGNDPLKRDAMTAAVLAKVGAIGGSVSAEHGIGLDKREYLSLSRSTAELEAMRRIKQALDPRNIMNPGKIFVPAPLTGDA